MKTFLKNFRRSEDGAITVDWVVLTAGVVGLVIAVIAAIETNSTGLLTAAGTAVTAQNDGFGAGGGGS